MGAKRNKNLEIIIDRKRIGESNTVKNELTNFKNDVIPRNARYTVVYEYSATQFVSIGQIKIDHIYVNGNVFILFVTIFFFN